MNSILHSIGLTAALVLLVIQRDEDGQLLVHGHLGMQLACLAIGAMMVWHLVQLLVSALEVEQLPYDGMHTIESRRRAALIGRG